MRPDLRSAIGGHRLSFTPIPFALSREEFVEAFDLISREDTRKKIRKAWLFAGVIVAVSVYQLILFGENEAVPILLGFAVISVVCGAVMYAFIFTLPRKWAWEAYSEVIEVSVIHLGPDGFYIADQRSDKGIGGRWLDVTDMHETDHTLVLSSYEPAEEERSPKFVLSKSALGEERVHFIRSKLEKVKRAE